MHKVIIFALLLSIPPHIVRGATKAKQIYLTQHTDIKDRTFQSHFIAELNDLVDTAASDHLNRLLEELRTNKDFVVYATKIESAASSSLLVPKIVYLKQLLDIKQQEQAHSVENFYTLRNLNFLNKLKHELLKLQDESAEELRQLRWYNLCRQFWFRDNLNQTKAAAPNNNAHLPLHQNANYWSNVKLAPLRANTVTATPPKAHIDIERFGSALYANIKSAGSEIIDDYLLTVRKLLQEVVEEKHIASEEDETVDNAAATQNDASRALHATKLSKLLTEIDAILAIDDFYEKRNRLYAYLEKDLSADYEQFKNSQYAHEDLAVILAKLQSKGLDLFVTFIFSNFEFLEHLHETWAKLLPEPTAAAPDESQLHYDVMSQRLFDVHRFYVEFKNDWQNNERYDVYQNVVKELNEATRNGSANMHVFELLHNASGNVGSVTLNMIKGKCDEF
ncbi:uncharacterized protein [Eurosta solidaginis]|uniref:uncharacterized protein n=1 Tax=Eurosta solidaginis TaxID=178769 RepID=UPI00353114CB